LLTNYSANTAGVGITKSLNIVKPVQNHEILLLPEVADRLRISIGTVNRLLAKRRNGDGNFPLPISAARSKGRWRARDIDKYIESLDVVKQDKNSDFQKRQAKAREVLREHGIILKQR